MSGTDTRTESGELHDVTAYRDGSRYWRRDGRLHRLAGPAVEKATAPTGSAEVDQWWVDGLFVTGRDDDPRFKLAVMRYLMKTRG